MSLLLALQAGTPGAIAGTAALNFSQSGDLSGDGALTAIGQITLGQSGTLTATGVMVAEALISFDGSATADVPASGAIEGVGLISFNGSATADQVQQPEIQQGPMGPIYPSGYYVPMVASIGFDEPKEVVADEPDELVEADDVKIESKPEFKQEFKPVIPKPLLETRELAALKVQMEGMKELAAELQRLKLLDKIDSDDDEEAILMLMLA